MGQSENSSSGPRRRRRRLARWATVAAIGLGVSVTVGAGTASAQDRPGQHGPSSPAETAQPASAAENCQALAAQDLAETVAITAVLVAPGQAVAGQADLPEFCRVSLTVSPAINIEVWLPTATYNGRFQAVGGGGYAGNISYPAMARAL